MLEIYGEPVERLTAKDDKPLSADEAKKEDDKLQKIIDKRKNESEDDRRKRLEKEEKEPRRGSQVCAGDRRRVQLPAGGFRSSRRARCLGAGGRASSRLRTQEREAKILGKFKGRVWIDKSEAQWVKLDITAIDTISFGLVLARIHKGTRVLVELTK